MKLSDYVTRWELLLFTILIIVWIGTAMWTQRINSKRQDRQITIFKADIAQIKSEQKELKEHTEQNSNQILHNQTDIMNQIKGLRKDIEKSYGLK